MTELTSLPRDIKQMYVYKGVKEGPQEGKMSALVVSETGDVFGIGVNTIVGCSTYHNEYPMLKGGSQVLNRWVKINRLSGLGIKQIIVGSGFGAAIAGNELLTWGRGPVTSLGRQAVVRFQGYQAKLKCRLCLKNHYYTERNVGGATLSYCSELKQYPILSDEFATHGITVWKFLRFHDDSIYCSRCTKQCTFKEMNSIPLYYCAPCDLFWDADANVGSLKLARDCSSQIRLQPGITDITPYGWGIWVLNNNQLVWKGFVKLPMWEERPATNPDNVIMSSVHCSHSGTFVNSENGELYCCTDLTLKKLPIAAAVIKICSGRDASVCLLADNSVWVVHENSPPERLLSTGSLAVDLSVLHGHDIFYVQTEANVTSVTVEMKYGRNHTLEINMGQSESIIFLWDIVCSLPMPNSFTTSSALHPRTVLPGTAQSKPPGPATSAPQTPKLSGTLPKSSSLQITAASLDSEQLRLFLASLYGQKNSSDMTIKLSDGDIHVHRCVLMETSAHFKKSLSDTTAPVIVDMSSANPDAYRCLLKHFYKQEPDELDMDGLFDLRQLAISYEETELAEKTEEKIRTLINEDNVLYAFGMSKLFSCEKIHQHCGELMKSPTIKDQLMNKAIQNPLLLLLFLNQNTRKE